MMMPTPRSILLAAIALLLSAGSLAAEQPLLIDASAATAAPGPANYSFDAADAKSPDGHVLGLNAQYLTLDGKPWLPVMGEMHYTRVPESEWESEILKMKSAGVQVIATYIIWIHHEEVEGQWDWAGQKDLRRFTQLCARHGMYVLPRIGPWSHAEVRNGGFPDWLLAKTTQQRSNDPAYLGYVDTLYKQVGAQLKGLMWSQGGPVIAVQLENEYNKRCSLCGTQHILTLKQMARDAGLRVPFYTATGWDGAAIPKGAVLPVYGGYPDAPWDASIKQLKPSEVYAFRFGSRVTGDMGAVGGKVEAVGGQVPTGNAANFSLDTPFITAEMGGGMQVTYHRRPVVSANDIAAMMPVMLGSGVNLYGSYMFHGGENPDGKLTTLQESLATHYANDLPQKSYDFEAPIGEFGDERPSLLKLKLWNYFLNDFGADLAPMQPRRPEVVPTGPRDLTTPRISARTNGASGFLFVNNHVRGYQMPSHPNFQVAIKLPGDQTLTLPSKPITLPADAYFVWPFNMDLSGLHLRFATAQPLAILGTKEAPVYAFFAQPNIPAEFVIDETAGLSLDPQSILHRSIEVTHDGSRFTLRQTRAIYHESRGFMPVFHLHDGRVVTILLLTERDALESWRVSSPAGAFFVESAHQAYVGGDLVTLQNLGDDSGPLGLNISYSYFPSGIGTIVPLDTSGHEITRSVGSAEMAKEYALHPTPPGVVQIAFKQTKPADAAASLPAGFAPSSKPRVVAAAPTEADWSRAATYSIPLPKSALADTPAEQHFLRITYTGDV
ncbi:MAG: beta-galactosidase, partial [Acidobacteriaceae bacterium]|nr:beta-galactosidase [Acidobacteriaceae bacterium]